MCSQGAQTFSDAETAQMLTLLSLSTSDLELMLGGCTFIFEQAAYATTAAESLGVELIGAGVSEAHANAFAATWQAGAAECVQLLKENAVYAARPPLPLSSLVSLPAVYAEREGRHSLAATASD